MISKEEAERILADVKDEHHFVLSNGVRLKNLHDLSAALSDMEVGTYIHHVNNERNDFCNWIQDVHKDEVLKTRIAEANGPLELRSAVSQRISELESAGVADEIEKKKPEKIKRKRLIKPKPVIKEEPELAVPKPHTFKREMEKYVTKLKSNKIQIQMPDALKAIGGFFRDFSDDMSILFKTNAEEVWDDILDLLYIKKKK